MSYLVRQDDTILLEDGRPIHDDLGRLVILHGGGPASSRAGGIPTTTATGSGGSSSPTTPDTKATMPRATTPSPTTCPQDILAMVT
jgi:hypothetical protein